MAPGSFYATIRFVPGGTWAEASINLHGHSHGRLKPLPRQFDVGVDVWDFRPVRLADIVGGTGPRSRRSAVPQRSDS